jgi:hypothetical protein
MLVAANALQPSKPLIMACFAGFYQATTVKLSVLPGWSVNRDAFHFKK